MTHLFLMLVLSQSNTTDDLKNAVKDAKNIGPVATRTRYLTLSNIPDLRRVSLYNVVSFTANSLSKTSDIRKPRLITPTLLAFNIDEYGWDPAIWEKLAELDPYYHALIETTVVEQYYQGNVLYNRNKQVKQVVFSPLMFPENIAALATLTQSQAPILRADWWFSQVSIQAGRKGVGYYDWLGIKDRATFQVISGFDQKASQKINREVAAIVSRSGVAQNPRQIFRFQALTGGYWITKDAITDNKDARNALRNLDDTFKHEAEEHYGALPNGLYYYFLGDAAGKRQDSAPDGIGPDSTAPGKDQRIHIFLSCVRCHIEGLRPIDDWGRRVFTGRLKLSSPDYEKTQRLYQLYLADIAERLEDDRGYNTRVIKRLTGWSTEKLSTEIGLAWKEYMERNLTPEDAAKELGVTEKEYLDALGKAADANPLFDPVLSSHLATPPVAIRTDDWEQVFQLALSYMGKK